MNECSRKLLLLEQLVLVTDLSLTKLPKIDKNCTEEIVTSFTPKFQVT
jgi:hypothetical protein